MLLQPSLRRHSGEISTSNLVRCRKNMTTVNWSTREFIAVNSTEPRKTVHFADTKGLALVSTFFFTTDKSLQENLTQQEHFGHVTTEFGKIRQVKRPKPTGERVRLLNYKSSIPTKTFEENLHKNNVSLEKTFCNKNGVYGRIRVKNIKYEKEVMVRYTLDSWATYKEQIASYILGGSVDNTDTFFFHVTLPSSNLEQKMEFALRYKVNGQTHWDNNFGDNYRLLHLPPS